MSSPNASPLPILLVEDSPDDVFFFRRAVSKCSVAASAQVAADGEQAIDYLLGRGRFADRGAYPLPVVIFLDLKLPHLNGFELLEWMRRHAECPTIPVVVLSSSNETEDRQRATALGAISFLTKPPTSEQISVLLQNYLPKL